jgi:hypothetical protein
LDKQQEFQHLMQNMCAIFDSLKIVAPLIYQKEKWDDFTDEECDVIVDFVQELNGLEYYLQKLKIKLKHLQPGKRHEKYQQFCYKVVLDSRKSKKAT